MKLPRMILLLIATLASVKAVHAQGLRGILVETYYIAQEADAVADPDQALKEGDIVYRIYAHLEPDYKLLAVYGTSSHPLYFKTTTRFYNNADRGKQTGTELSTSHLTTFTTALDSYLAIGGASRRHYGIPKVLDEDVSIFSDAPIATLDGSSVQLLRNTDKKIGLPLFENDGLIVEESGIKSLVTFGDLELDVFHTRADASVFLTENGAYAVAGGLRIPATDNNILIAQITTDGDLSFKLNLQIQSLDGSTYYYVASQPDNKQQTHPDLTYPNSPKP